MSAEGWIYSVVVLCAVQVLVLWRDTPDLRLAAISRHTGRNIAGRGIDTSGRPGKSRGRQDIADIISSGMPADGGQTQIGSIPPQHQDLYST